MRHVVITDLSDLQKVQVAKDLAVEGLSLYWHEAERPASPCTSSGHALAPAEQPAEPEPDAMAAEHPGSGAHGAAEGAGVGSDAAAPEEGVQQGDLVLLPLCCLLRLTMEDGRSSCRRTHQGTMPISCGLGLLRSSPSHHIDCS